MAKLTIGKMFISPVAQSKGKESLILEGMEMLLADGRQLNPKIYKRLTKLTRARGFGNKLPDMRETVWGAVDHYVAARRAITK